MYAMQGNCNTDELKAKHKLQARSQGGSVGLEEPPSQRKVHYLVMKGLLLKK